MPVRTSNAVWEGNLKGGKGRVSTESNAIDQVYSFRSRFENGEGTNPEELIGAAHAGCFSMAFAAELDQAGFTPGRIMTRALVHLDKKEDGFEITMIELVTEAEVKDVDENKFQEIAAAAKENCPVSKALRAVPVTLKAKLN